MDEQLWIAVDARRYFIIADATPWPTGTDVLTTITGARSVSTDLTALAPFEVDRERARAWLSARAASEIDAFANRVSGGISAWLRAAAEPGSTAAGASSMQGAVPSGFGRLAEALRRAASPPPPEAAAIAGERARAAAEHLRHWAEVLDHLTDSERAGNDDDAR